MKKLILCAMALGAASVALPSQARYYHHQHHRYYHSNGCNYKRSAAVGTVAGAIGGGIVAGAIGHGNGPGTLLGAGVGALAGHEIGKTKCH
jgi:hypothetical protein